MRENKFVSVFYKNTEVGKLAETVDHRVAFQYTDEWLRRGFSISPFSLPLTPEVFVPGDFHSFNGLFGVFSDSLPDGWGRLLVDRMLRQNGLDPNTTTELFRLGLVGDMGMGALEYYPSHHFKTSSKRLSFDIMARQCIAIFQDESCDNLDEIYQNGGSSGGARPKVNINMDNALWIVKFSTSFENKSVGLMEYQYMECAKNCGIDVPEFRLLQSDWCDGYFAVKRFDRDNGNKRHMISLSALLETSHRIPNLDYLDIFKVITLLNNEHSQIEEMYRRMCFNVFAHNRDDHSKNFSFLFEEQHHQYVLSPAYDLTYSNSIGGEHATTIDGVGDKPELKNLVDVARKVGLKESWAKQTALEIQDKVEHQLSQWLNQY